MQVAATARTISEQPSNGMAIPVEVLLQGDPSATQRAARHLDERCLNRSWVTRRTIDQATHPERRCIVRIARGGDRNEQRVRPAWSCHGLLKQKAAAHSAISRRRHEEV